MESDTFSFKILSRFGLNKEWLTLESLLRVDYLSMTCTLISSFLKHWTSRVCKITWWIFSIGIFQLLDLDFLVHVTEKVNALNFQCTAKEKDSGEWYLIVGLSLKNLNYVFKQIWAEVMLNNYLFGRRVGVRRQSKPHYNYPVLPPSSCPFPV